MAALPGDMQFAVRRRIAMLEPDTAHRSVMTRSLLALACVVSAKRDLAQVCEALQCGPYDGVIIALDGNMAQVADLQAANVHDIPIVVLTDSPVEPRFALLFPAVRFLRKPFDTRQLLVELKLPLKAILAASE